MQKTNKKNVNRIIAQSFVLFCAYGANAYAGSYTVNANGVIVTPDVGDKKEVRLTVMNDAIINVIAVPNKEMKLKPSLMVNASPIATKFTTSVNGENLTLKTSKVTAIVNTTTGAVEFKKASGVTSLKEEGTNFIKPIVIEGPTKTPDDKYFTIQQQFNKNTKEAFYGLGQQQNAVINFNGEDALLMQHNMHIAVPFVVSDKNYGVLWDNNSITRWGNDIPYAHLDRDFAITDLNGNAGGFTAKYYVDGQLKVTRQEAKIDFQFIPDLVKNWPKEIEKGTKAPNQKVVWEGEITPNADGIHKFQLYSSGYAKLYIDGKLVKDVWRQNWNPWYHNFEINMKSGKKQKFKLEWVPEEGYITVLHNNPTAAADKHSMKWTSEAGEAINYYYIDGKSADDVIKGYRQITGKSSMMPKWSYGFWQSRQRYKTQEELVGVLKEYRKRKIPIDNIVLDWNYWPDDQWGSHDFDLARFPDAKKMVDEVHSMNAKIMISVWGKFYPNTENFKELDAKGYVYRRNIEIGDKDWVGPGYLNTHYDPYSKESRDIFWRQVQTKLESKGFDAWWADNTEPDIHSNIPVEEMKLRIGPTTFGPGAAVYNPYSLVATQAFADGEKETNPDKRAFILTRSGFGGLQRNSSAVWSGDVVSRWDNLYNQIAAGISISYSGIPNWTHDIGGFSTEKRYNAEVMKPEDLREWQELNLRWFQFGAFSPLFRSHGEFPLREVYNLGKDGSEIQNNLIWFTKLRYRLMPYIYSTAAATHYNDGSIMRGLQMDFGNDAAVKNINDQYLFGKNIMVAPVYTDKQRSRSVYLPSGTSWYNYYTGALSKGGQKINVAAPLTQMPLFVKAGAIIPSTIVMQYTDEVKNAPITLNVYAGANGEFNLYDDDGVSKAFERGEFANIKITYDDASKTVTIGKRQGKYKDMPMTREFRVRFISANMSSTNFDAFDKSVTYKGQEIKIKK